MASDWRRVLVLSFLLMVGCPGSSSSSHFLHYFNMALSEPGQELPQFIAVGYVDDQLFTRYDSHTRRRVPVAPWMEKVGKDDPQYWEESTQRVRNTESLFRANLETLRSRYNQSHGGLHTLQLMYGCDVGLDRQPRGAYFQYAYDGEDFLAFDKETLTWTTCMPQAKITKDKLDMRLDISHLYKDYLEGTCVEWLQTYLDYGKEALLRTEKPTVKVALKKGYNGQETLFCHIYGFYPKAIGVTWMKNGEDQISETFTGGVVPNSDGTYHTWLSIDIDPMKRGLYRCHVEHDSLPEPLEKAWEDPASKFGIIIVFIFSGIMIVPILLGFIIFHKKRRAGCKAALKKKQIDANCPPPPLKTPLDSVLIPTPEKQQLENLYSLKSNGIPRISSTSSCDSGHSSGSSNSDDSDPGCGTTKPFLR